MQIDCKINPDLIEESDVPEPDVKFMSKLENMNDAIDQRTSLKTNQLPHCDSEKLEPNTMPGSVDAVSVVQELPQSCGEPRADLSGPDVNSLPEAEDEAVNVKALEQNQRSGIAEDDGFFCGPSSDHGTCKLGTDIEDLTTIVFIPDHIVYRDSYSTNCTLTFTSSYIKVDGSLDADDQTFKFQWGVQDILNITSHWYEVVGMALVTINVRMDDTVHAEDVECTSGAELRFVDSGSNWYRKQEAIKALNAAYKRSWSCMLESQDIHGHTQASFTKYFPNFNQPFEEVIYPKGDVDAVSISKRDVDLLLPDTFVNDTIIDFYIKYLKNKLKPEETHRFHFFNSFFFRKLADLDKDPLDVCEGKAAFQRVRKWTRKVNLFEKDYVFIPVNYKYHWSLIVMCHLGEVATYKDEDVMELIKVPCVLHMDSIRGSHVGLKGLMQSYLKEEWEGRQQEASEHISSRFDNLRFISLELPQQPNTYDCGLFLLHYVELFLEQAPMSFNPFKITNSVNFLNVDWFSPSEASLKRVVIQRLVYDLLEQPSRKAPFMAANGEHCNLSCSTTNILRGTAVNFFPEMSNPSTTCQPSQADRGIEIALLPSLSLISEPCPEDPCIALKPAFETGSFLAMHFPSFNDTAFGDYKSSLAPPIQEDVETGGQFVYSPTEIALGHSSGATPEASVMPYSQDLKRKGLWNQNNTTSPETSVSGCEDSLEVINGSDHIDPQLNFNEKRNQPTSPMMEPIKMHDRNGNTDDVTNSLHRSEMQANEPTGLGSDVQHPSKRLRTTEPPLEGESAYD